MFWSTASCCEALYKICGMWNGLFVCSRGHVLQMSRAHAWPKGKGLRFRPTCCQGRSQKQTQKTEGKKKVEVDILAREESSFVYLHLKGHCAFCSVNSACEEHGRWKNKLGVTTHKAKTTQQEHQPKKLCGGCRIKK